MPTYVVTGPDGARYRVTAPEGATEAEVRARVQGQAKKPSGPVPAWTQPDKRPTSFWQGVTDGLQAPAMNAGRLLAKSNPLAALSDLTPFGATRAIDALDKGMSRASAKQPYRGSTAGKITGGLLGSLPTALLPGGPIAQGAAGGALLSERTDPATLAKNAAIGAVGGKLGDEAGRRIIAPVAERIGRTAPARAASRAAVNAINKVMPGRASTLPLPNISRSERTVAKAAPEMDMIRQNVADAERLGLPYALADADPKLRALAGSVTRFSPTARTMAENNFDMRARGQADRAIRGIDELLAPRTDIIQRSADILEGGKPVYGPLYDAAYDAPAITSERLQQVLASPAGRQAAGRANTIAANEFRDPMAMGFGVDEAGEAILNPVATSEIDRLDAARSGWDAAQAAYNAALRRRQASLTPSQFSDEFAAAENGLAAANAELDAARAAFSAAPRSTEVAGQNAYTTQSLDYIKRGIDDILEPQRNQFTGKLQLDEGGRAINNVQRELISEVDRLNPLYREARDAYGGYAKQTQALREGFDVLPSGTLPERDFNRIVNRATEYDGALPDPSMATLPELRRGYATSMADTVDRQRFSTNPYDTVYGSPLQQNKVATLFPDGSPDFNRQYGLERDMAATRAETLGGSQTQPRKVADEFFQSDIANTIGDGAIQALTGGGVPGGMKMLGTLAQMAKDRSSLGLLGAQKRADQMAPALLGTDNPRAILDYLDDLARKQAEEKMRKDAYARAMGSLFAGPVGVLGVAGSQ